MGKITKIDKKACRQIRDEMQAVLDKYGVSANMEFKVGNMSYAADNTVNIKVAGKIAGAVTADDRMLKSMMSAHGLKFTSAKGEKLIGYNTRRPKYPFSYVTVRGANYKCSIDQAKRLFIA